MGEGSLRMTGPVMGSLRAMGKVMGKTMAREVGEAMVVGRVQKSAEY